MTIEEGNKLIAGFMGHKVSYGLEKAMLISTGDINYTPVKYHKSWDWLMPVVEKIDKDFSKNFEVIIYSASCYIHKWNEDKQVYDTFISGVGKKIDAVYGAVIEFIKWYNENRTI